MSRLSPSLSVDDVSSYVNDIIGEECIVEKLNTRYPTYSSFVIRCKSVWYEKLMNGKKVYS